MAKDMPEWVAADPAARWCWGYSKGWRHQARSCLPPVHRPLGDGGTLGDLLLVQARRGYLWQKEHAMPGAASERSVAGPASASAAVPRPQAGERCSGALRSGSSVPRATERAHAPGCVCARCRAKRGEAPLPTPQQQRQRRRYDHAVVPKDFEHRPAERISLDPRCTWVRLSDALRDPSGKITTCEVRSAFVGYLDGLLRKGLLDQLWAQHPHLARAFTGCALDGRRQEDVAQEEGVTQQTISYRLGRAKAIMKKAATS